MKEWRDRPVIKEIEITPEMVEGALSYMLRDTAAFCCMPIGMDDFGRYEVRQVLVKALVPGGYRISNR